MNIARTAFLAAVALGVAAIGRAAAQAPTPASSARSAGASDTAIPPKGGVSIGVVDFVKVLEAYPRAIQERKKIDEFVKQREAALEAEGKKIRELRAKCEDLREGTLERDLKEHELRLKLQDIDGMQKVFANERRRKIDEFYVAIYEDMQRAVRKVAESRGVTLVLRVHDDVFDGSVGSKARVFEERVVWYAGPDIDLTPAIIQLLQVPLPEEPVTPKPADQQPSKEGKEGTGG